MRAQRATRARANERSSQTPIHQPNLQAASAKTAACHPPVNARTHLPILQPKYTHGCGMFRHHLPVIWSCAYSSVPQTSTAPTWKARMAGADMLDITEGYIHHISQIHTYIHTHIHTQTHTYTHIHIHTYTQTHTHTYTHIHLHTFTHIHTNTHTYTHTHIHTHTHTNIIFSPATPKTAT